MRDYLASVVWVAMILFPLAARSAVPVTPVIPMLRKSQRPSCQTIVIDQSNLMGFMSFVDEGEQSQLKILYKEGEGRGELALTVSHGNSEVLKKKLGDLMKKVRFTPIRIVRSLSKEGNCAAWAIED
jgi:hypothetical protein